ncbi:uncharacterized protein [Diadema setosum]|uniref:uncharacterized protein n=1 Tax=Diadema setosum TaxID=31175 RepID=UPI003B3AF4DB
MGFNVKFVSGPVSRDLICPLCRGVFVDPVVLHPCEHVVCTACLKACTSRVQLLQSCPHCRNPLFEKPTLAPHHFIARLLKLIVKCHRECGHKCELSALPEHVLNECILGVVSCPNKVRGCHKELKRKMLDAHVKECDFRLVTCEGCGAEMVYSRLALHQKRRRCVEGKLLGQRVRSAAAAMRQVREHQELLRKEVITLEGQLMRLRSSKLEARGRLKSAPPRLPGGSTSSSTSTSRPESSRSTVSIASQMSTKKNRGPPKAPTIFLTDATSSFDVLPFNATSTSSSRSSPRQASSDHEEDEDSMAVAMIVDGETSSDERSSSYGNQGESMLTCKRCRKTFHPDTNHDRACRWHRGTCMICGQLNFKRGCVVGYHLAADPSKTVTFALPDKEHIMANSGSIEVQS